MHRGWFYTLYKECESKIDVEYSNITVGDNGNVDSLLNSLAYSVEEELEYA